MPLLKVLSKLRINNKKILSLGCGSCALEAVLEKKFFCEVTGLDYSKDAIAKAKTRIKKAFVIDLEKKSIKSVVDNNKFDVIIFADILEHLRNPYFLLKECKNLLSSEGKIVVSIPNVANWSVRLNLLFGRFNYASAGIMDKTHVKFYTFKTANKLVRNSGYKILKIRYSTSLVNILYGLLNKKKQESIKTRVTNQAVNQKKNLLRKCIKIVLEFFDKYITLLFPKIFAYQFIIIATQKTLVFEPEFK